MRFVPTSLLLTMLLSISPLLAQTYCGSSSYYGSSSYWGSPSYYCTPQVVYQNCCPQPCQVYYQAPWGCCPPRTVFSPVPVVLEVCYVCPHFEYASYPPAYSSYYSQYCYKPSGDGWDSFDWTPGYCSSHDCMSNSCTGGNPCTCNHENCIPAPFYPLSAPSTPSTATKAKKHPKDDPVPDDIYNRIKEPTVQSNTSTPVDMKILKIKGQNRLFKVYIVKVQGQHPQSGAQHQDTFVFGHEIKQLNTGETVDDDQAVVVGNPLHTHELKIKSPKLMKEYRVHTH